MVKLTPCRHTLTQTRKNDTGKGKMLMVPEDQRKTTAAHVDLFKASVTLLSISVVLDGSGAASFAVRSKYSRSQYPIETSTCKQVFRADFQA